MPATVNLKSTNLGSLLNVVLDSLTPWAICHTVLIRGLTTVQRSQTVFDNMKYFFETWMFTLWRFRMISRYALNSPFHDIMALDSNSDTDERLWCIGE